VIRAAKIADDFEWPRHSSSEADVFYHYYECLGTSFTINTVQILAKSLHSPDPDKLCLTTQFHLNGN